MTNPTTDSLAQAIDNLEVYFIPLGTITENELSYERFMPISFTYDAWGPFQYGASPFALLTRMLERCRLKSEGMRITRIAVDLLSVVSYTELWTCSWVSRSGRQIAKVEAELLAGVKGVWCSVAIVSAWVMVMADTQDIERALDKHVSSLAESTVEYIPLIEDWSGGYIESIEARAVATEDDAGTQIHWVHTPHPVVLGEEPTAMERVMQVVDTANGIGAIPSLHQWAFMNTDLVVRLHRLPQLGMSEKSAESEPQSEDSGWVDIAARGSIGPDRTGMMAGEPYDAHGPVGRSMQTLLVRPQG